MAVAHMAIDHGSLVMVDETGMTSSQFVATQDGFAVLSMEETDDEILIDGAVGTVEKEQAEE